MRQEQAKGSAHEPCKMANWVYIELRAAGMSLYETLPPDNFLGLDAEHSAYEHSAALILPIPYEGTVSYGQGTREGPRAIIHASQQVELYDRELDDEPALTYGVHTLPSLAPVVSGPADMVAAIAACAEEHLRTGKLLIGLGGLDPALVPATGTPEPGGLGWAQALDIVRTVVRAGQVVAADCVELAPIPGQHASDFLAAKLVYKVIGLVLSSRPPTTDHRRPTDD